MSGALPLDGVRVLAVEQYGAGPWASLQLAEMGADVIKVEDPRVGGDVGRYVPPYQAGEDSLFFETFNHGKRSVSLDLRHPVGRDVLHDLVRHVDAVFCNLRGDHPAKLGITYEQLRDYNERIVCCSLTGYGRTGPLAAHGAYDYVIQARAGWMAVTGEPEGPPIRSGPSLVDYCGGYVAALSLLGGLWQARRDGIGCDCDVSLFETALSLQTYVATWVATEGHVPTRRSNSAHPSIVPFQSFPTADSWLVVACPKDSFWRSLCPAVGLGELAADPRFATLAGRFEHRDELVERLTEAFRARATDDWIATLTDAGIPCAPINSVADALDDPQALAREDIVSMQHPNLGLVQQVASPLRVGKAPRQPVRAPFRGEHTRDVLASLCGYDAAKIAELAHAGALGLGTDGAAVAR